MAPFLTKPRKRGTGGGTLHGAPDKTSDGLLEGLRDSKLLRESEREREHGGETKRGRGSPVGSPAGEGLSDIYERSDG